jgi:glycosyltransferase involved in cell wall biosynthesis
MEILQVCPFSYTGVGGVSVHVQKISEALARRHNVTAYAANFKSRFPKYAMENGVKVERFRVYAPSDAYFFSWEMLLRLLKVEFDVVHAHCYHAFPIHFSAQAKCKKFVVTTHFHGVGHTPFRNSLVGLFQPFGKRTLKKANSIIAVSEYEKSLLLKLFKLNEGKVFVIPNGIDFGEFSGLNRRNHDFKSVLYVGYLSGFKGVHYLVEVLPRLSNDIVVDIVGKGPLRHFLEKRAKELKVHERIRFYQDLPRHELLQKYADAGVLVLLSKYEAYSLAVAEALAAGTPCIVANTSALSEWVDNETCFGVNVPFDLGKLAALIEYVLDNGVTGHAIKKWIGTKILDWNEVALRLEDVYETNLED